MYKITVSSAEKKTLGSILFVAKYNSQKEANQARSQLIKMAGERRLAPADTETGHTVVYAKPRKWHVGEVVKY